MASPPTIAVPRRTTYAIFGTGLFANGQWDMLAVLVPLYAALVGLSPVEIGLIVSARSVLPTLFSIHGGIMMDRYGARRVLIWLATATATLPLLYPAADWFPILFALQMALGLAGNLTMAGAQTLINRISRGDTASIANFSLACRVGTFAGPIIVGATWDILGSWAAFACIAIWGAGTLVATLLAGTETNDPVVDVTPSAPARQGSVAAWLPKWAEHMQAVALAAIPAVAFILVLTFLRNGPGAIQASFYVVYLGEIGLTGTIIGALIGASEFFAGVGAVVAAPVARRMRAHWLVVAFVGSAILFIVITPLIGQFLVLLVVAAALRGLSQGVNQPVMYSILSRSVGPDAQGAAVGLRNTVNRLSSLMLPTAMGLAAGQWGIEASFYVMGIVLLATCGALAIVIRYKRTFED